MDTKAFIIATNSLLTFNDSVFDSRFDLSKE